MQKTSIFKKQLLVMKDFLPNMARKRKESFKKANERFRKDLKTKEGKLRIFKRMSFYTLMIFLSAIFLFPSIWMLVSTLKTEAQIFADINSLRAFMLPDTPIGSWFNGYKDVFTRFNLFSKMAFSFQYAFALIVGTVFINSLAGYALAKFDFPFKNFWIAFIITLIIVPVETTIIPLFVVVDRFGLVGRFAGLFVPGMANAFNIFLFRQFFIGIPKELEEAAVLDGANRFQIYMRIIFPLSKPVFATVAIFAFIGAWNDFLWPIMILGGSDTMPLQVYLTEMINTYPVFMNQVLAALTISTIPILLVYAFFQKYIVQGIAHTGIK